MSCIGPSLSKDNRNNYQILIELILLLLLLNCYMQLTKRDKSETLKDVIRINKGDTS